MTLSLREESSVVPRRSTKISGPKTRHSHLPSFPVKPNVVLGRLRYPDMNVSQRWRMLRPEICAISVGLVPEGARHHFTSSSFPRSGAMKTKCVRDEGRDNTVHSPCTCLTPDKPLPAPRLTSRTTQLRNQSLK